MLNEQTIAKLNALKLFGMARAFEERLSSAKQAELSHADFVGLLVQDEKTHRDNLRLRRLLRKAKLRQEASLEDIDYGAARGLSHQVILVLFKQGFGKGFVLIGTFFLQFLFFPGPKQRRDLHMIFNRHTICVERR